MKNMRKVITFLLVLTAFFFTGKNVNASGGTVYVSVEKFTLGQGYLVEPMAVPFNEGENFAQIFDRVIRGCGYEYENGGTLTENFYLSVINKADNGIVDIPECIQKMEAAGSIKPPSNEDDLQNEIFPDLGEMCYGQMSGWYYFVNNKNPQLGMSEVKAKDGDVVRYQFTLYGYGADLGDGSSYGGITSLKLPDRTNVTKNMAVLNQYMSDRYSAGAEAVYKNAVCVVSDMDSTESQIEAVDQALLNQIRLYQNTDSSGGHTPAPKPPENQNSQGIKTENPAVSQEKTVKIKKTSLKSIKRAGNRKVKLSWKRVSKADGYFVYMSKKKSKGFKKVKTLKQGKKTTAVISGLKKKKTYYFKVRAFKKTGGKTYYGGYSKVKKIKIK